MIVLITGAAGYIGSHAAMRLLELGNTVLAVDDLSAGHPAAVNILQSAYPSTFHFAKLDIADTPALTELLRAHAIDRAIHFAGRAVVTESLADPLGYHWTNTACALSLLRALDAVGATRLIYSSTCAAFGQPSQDNIPVSEACPTAPISPYGVSKLAFEHALTDYTHSCAQQSKPFGAVALRYFNVAGCHHAGKLGEHRVPQSRLVPALLEAALGVRETFLIQGADYPTPDGTAIRDYIHVEDLVEAHINALSAITLGASTLYNLGIGAGYSVLEMVNAAKEVTGIDIPTTTAPRRPGDPAALYADPTKARSELNFAPKHTTPHSIIESAWRWFKDHPTGYPQR